MAPKPQPYTLPWLCISWSAFTFGLLAVILVFLFSHKTCIARIEESAAQYANPDAKPAKDIWGILTSGCNWAVLYSIPRSSCLDRFCSREHSEVRREVMPEKPQIPTQPDIVKKGYTPPRNAPHPPTKLGSPAPSTPPPVQKAG